MLEIFHKWYNRYLFEEESVLLLVLATISVVLLMTIGDILTPVLASIVLAYLMQGLSSRLQYHGLPQWVGVLVAYAVFLGIFFGVTLGLIPLVWRQLLSLAGELPRMLEQGRQLLSVLPEQYPDVVTTEQINQYVGMVQTELAGLGQTLVSLSLSSLPGVLTVMIYMILIPMLVFFFLKDREQILDWIGGFLHRERQQQSHVWDEQNLQFAH